MAPRARALVVVPALTTALLAGCTSGSSVRPIGNAVTPAEASALAELLHRDFQQGGAGFVATAPYGPGAILTLTGDVDFRHFVGRAQAVTSFGDGRADDTRTVFFTPTDLWVGDVPGLAAALAQAGSPKATYLRRPLVAPDAASGTPLLDVLVRMVVDLSSTSSDDRRYFLDGHTTWQGQRSIDSRLASMYRLRDGDTVAVATAGNLLLQYGGSMPGHAFTVTVTLADHGPRSVELPGDDTSVAASDQPVIAAAVGV
jgi:hypothetical protein